MVCSFSFHGAMTCPPKTGAVRVCRERPLRRSITLTSATEQVAELSPSWTKLYFLAKLLLISTHSLANELLIRINWLCNRRPFRFTVVCFMQLNRVKYGKKEPNHNGTALNGCDDEASWIFSESELNCRECVKGISLRWRSTGEYRNVSLVEGCAAFTCSMKEAVSAFQSSWGKDAR